MIKTFRFVFDWLEFDIAKTIDDSINAWAIMNQSEILTSSISSQKLNDTTNVVYVQVIYKKRSA